jgi:hypothetical protein
VAKRKLVVDMYESTCDHYLKRNTRDKTKIGMMELPISKTLFEFIGMDMTQLPTSKDGNNYILSILDHFSRYLVMAPMVLQMAEVVSKAFDENKS